MTPQGFQAATGVSRETLGRLEAYAALLVKWQARINLVGPATLPDLWRRHMLDSAQLFPLLPGGGPIVDLGSGAGFPGLVLAALGAADVHLIESDSRKCAFLREAARVMGVSVTVHNGRIESAPGFPAAAVTARALAPLARLLDWAERFVAPGTRCLFLKGQGFEDELTEARKAWSITFEGVASRSDPSGIILLLNEVKRVPA
ncbi:MAG: 16S rRNA (guanine(527)-N(7))-methyltransferase RsmG [Alphaproteobacteria bacterium]|nr:16S rRNA (guanine(527)-N(7))-methyltransferase RsmG [Alphaproteobacteria bacterium]